MEEPSEQQPHHSPSHREQVLAGRAPRIALAQVIDDGGILYHDAHFGGEYERTMQDLVEIYQDKVAASARGDLTLATDSPDINEREGEAIERLRNLYREIRNQEGGAEASVEARVQAIKAAAEAIKTAYDRWEKEHTPDFGIG